MLLTFISFSEANKDAKQLAVCHPKESSIPDVPSGLWRWHHYSTLAHRAGRGGPRGRRQQAAAAAGADALRRLGQGT